MTQTSPTATDRAILDLIRCEPPSRKFDYFRYDRLPRTVFKQLQKLGDLEEIIALNRGRNITFPSSREGNHKHHLSYCKEKNYHLIIANTFNQFSDYSDVKLIATTAIDNSPVYQATLIGLETYRREDKHPIWEIGFYITKKENNKIIYGEQTVVEISNPSNRSEMYKRFPNLADRLHEFKYSPENNGTVDSPEIFKVLDGITSGSTNITTVSPEDFKIIAPKRFRYLTGTQDVISKLKFDDRLGYEPELFRRYRVELIGSEAGSPIDRYLVLVLATTEAEEESSKHPDPNGKFLLFGPYDTKSKAEDIYLDRCIHFIKHLHINAELDVVPFPFDPNSRRDLKYFTIVPDKDHRPIIVTSWELDYFLKTELDTGERYPFLEIYSGAPKSLVVREEKDFKEQPRIFMESLLKTIEEVGYGNGQPFLTEARKRDILLKQPA